MSGSYKIYRAMSAFLDHCASTPGLASWKMKSKFAFILKNLAEKKDYLTFQAMVIALQAI